MTDDELSPRNRIRTLVFSSGALVKKCVINQEAVAGEKGLCFWKRIIVKVHTDLAVKGFALMFQRTLSLLLVPCWCAGFRLYSIHRPPFIRNPNSLVPVSVLKASLGESLRPTFQTLMYDIHGVLCICVPIQDSNPISYHRIYILQRMTHTHAYNIQILKVLT